MKEKKEKKIKEKKAKKEKVDKSERKINKFFSKFFETLKKKWLVDGSKTIILVLIIIGIYIGVNILLEKVILPEYDFTTDSVNSISEETIDKVSAIEMDISIIVVSYGDYDTMISLIEKYTTLSDYITMDRIDDLSERPDVMQTYSLDLDTPAIIISNGETETILYDEDMYTYDYTTYEYIDLSEEAITNAIINVSVLDKTKLYFLSNHVTSDYRYFATIEAELESETNEVEYLDLLSNGSIPDDCDTLIITTLEEDITEMERDLILEYINNAGELMIMQDVDLTGTDKPYFQSILDVYGITISGGVVFEQSSSNMLSGYPTLIIEEVSAYAVTGSYDETMQICLGVSGSIAYNEDTATDLSTTFTTIASTSDSAFLRTNFELSSYTKTSEDSDEGEYIVGGIVTKVVSEDGESTGPEDVSELIIFANEMFATDIGITVGSYQVTAVSLYNNTDIILNSIAYLNDKDDTITIRKNYDDVTYTLTEAQSNVVMTIIFTLPFVIIVIGVVVWVIRTVKGRK